jgi:hypothetical protein
MVTYWVDHSPSQGVFPKRTLSMSCKEYEVNGGVTSRNGVSWHTPAHIVSFMGAFVEGVISLELQTI